MWETSRGSSCNRKLYSKVKALPPSMASFASGAALMKYRYRLPSSPFFPCAITLNTRPPYSGMSSPELGSNGPKVYHCWSYPGSAPKSRVASRVPLRKLPIGSVPRASSSEMQPLPPNTEDLVTVLNAPLVSSKAPEQSGSYTRMKSGTSVFLGTTKKKVWQKSSSPQLVRPSPPKVTSHGMFSSDAGTGCACTIRRLVTAKRRHADRFMVRKAHWCHARTGGIQPCG